MFLLEIQTFIATTAFLNNSVNKIQKLEVDFKWQLSRIRVTIVPRVSYCSCRNSLSQIQGCKRHQSRDLAFEVAVLISKSLPLRLEFFSSKSKVTGL